MTTRTEAPTKSHGHLSFSPDGVFELYEHAGEIWRAPVSNVLDGDCRIGRWECSRTHFEHFRELYSAHWPNVQPTGDLRP